MRPPLAAGAIAGFVVLSALAYIGGRTLDQPSMTIGPEDLPSEISLPEVPLSDDASVAAIEAAATAEREASAASGGEPRFERVAPRAPLSELSLALPPKPESPQEWEGTILHRAVAPSAGLIEAMGYRVAIAGIEPVAADQSCSYEGRDWDCGVYARTAFRAFLRGRSPTCTVPPEPDRELVAADCRIGKQALGEWLVSNGWAKAAPGGPYSEAGAKAEAARLGIFGPPPSKGGLPQLPRSHPSIDATVREAPSIEILPEPEGAPSFETPMSAGQPAPSQ